MTETRSNTSYQEQDTFDSISPSVFLHRGNRSGGPNSRLEKGRGDSSVYTRENDRHPVHASGQTGEPQEGHNGGT